MQIAAIVLNYRNASSTLNCLRSLIGQGLKSVVVLDNSACVTSSEELTKAVDALMQASPGFELELIVAPSNIGFARGVNTALRSPMMEDVGRVLLINNDAIASPGMVHSLALEMDEHAALAATPCIVDLNGRAKPMVWYQRYFGLMTLFRLPGSFQFPSGCCLMVHRDFYLDGRLLDEDFFMYGEDVLLGWRLNCLSEQVWSSCNAVAQHAGRGSLVRSLLFYEYHTARGHVLLALKTYRSAFEIPLLLLSKTMGLLLRAVWRCLSQRRITPLLAFGMAWFPLDIQPVEEKD